MAKFYVFRITNHNGRKEYKRTKCANYWADNKAICWQFSKQGAKNIVDDLNSFKRTDFYTFGIEPVE